MTIDGKPHPHSFLRDGAETRNVQVDVTEGKGIEIVSSISGLHVLKSTGSQFWGFIRDEYTTLPETWDRILSTEVDATWKWKFFDNLQAVKADVPRFDRAWALAREITLKTFAEDDSASVQATMYRMGEQIIAAVPEVESVEYSLPNKHYFEVGKLKMLSLFVMMMETVADRSYSSQTSVGTRASRTPARMPTSTPLNPAPMA
jgi:urate oxidase